MTSMIPGNAPTVLPNGQVVTPSQSSVSQPGTRITPRTSRGSGVYGGAGAVSQPVNAPVRDYVVRLRNEGTDFRMRYLTVEYFIAEDDELIVPWEVMVSFLGSPDTQNLGPRRMDRKNVYEKLRVKYGAYYDDDLWEQNKPRLAAYRVTGERLVTVVDDPDGNAITPSQVSVQAAMAQGAQIDLMKQQMEAMTQMIASLTGQSKSPTFQNPPPDQTVPFSTEGADPGMAPEAPEAPIQQPYGTAPAPVAPTPYDTSQQAPAIMDPRITVPLPPPPVPGMTPQMPIPVTSPSEDTGGGATQDMPSQGIQIG